MGRADPESVIPLTFTVQAEFPPPRPEFLRADAAVPGDAQVTARKLDSQPS
jgi:hypothetical protein